MQLSEESICGEAAGETSALPLPSPDPFLLLESLSITFTTNGLGNSCWEFLKIENEQIKTAQKNSYSLPVAAPSPRQRKSAPSLRFSFVGGRVRLHIGYNSYGLKIAWNY